VAQITQQDNTWHLSGDLVFANISAVLDETKALEMPAQLELDFTKVAEVDTSAISLVLELQRRAIAQSAIVNVAGVSANLTSLMQLYGVDEIILKS
jgi:phospholipid transport system transporter-binding protein